MVSLRAAKRGSPWRSTNSRTERFFCCCSLVTMSATSWGVATGFWSTTSELIANWNESKRWTPQWTAEQRDQGYAGWKKAVQRTLDWVDVS